MLRRGFKSQCERKSAEIRKSLGLVPDAPLRGLDLAPIVGTVVWSESEIVGLPVGDLKQLTQTDWKSWSAFTLRIGTRHLIVYNSAQSAPRINSVVLHELAHIALGHELHSAHISDDGHFVPSNYNQDQEDEADWFGGTLLLPRQALINIRRRGMSDQQAMSHYQASEAMLMWRRKTTGVDIQFGRFRSAAGQ